MSFELKTARGDAEPSTYNLLFVCTGNTCRSPLAAAIAQRALHERGWSHVRVRSAGVATHAGAPASEEACAVAAERGIDLQEHRTQPLSGELLEWADLVLAMSPSHLSVIAEIGGGEKAALLTDFIEGPGMGEPIADPFGAELDEYRLTYDQIERAVVALLLRLEPILSP